MTSVSTGEQLLAALRQSTFDVLIMDMEMLDVTVGEVVAIVRDQEANKKRHLSMVAMTLSKLQGANAAYKLEWINSLSNHCLAKRSAG